MDTVKPVFVTGYPRSGTTWMNSIFYNYFDAAFVNEAQFILKFRNALSANGDLSKERCVNRLIDNVLRDSFFTILSKAYRVEITREQIKRTLKERSYSGIVYAVLELIAQDLNKPVIGNKDPSLGMQLDVINKLFPSCKIVHIVRDGRDCALSHYVQTWGRKNAYMAALSWRNYVTCARNEGSKLGSRYFELRYEDLLDNPELIFARLESFVLGTNHVTSAYLEVHDKTIKKHNHSKWKARMPPKDQMIFETVAGDLLRELNYSCPAGPTSIASYEKLYYFLHDIAIRKAWSILRTVDPSRFKERISK